MIEVGVGSWMGRMRPVSGKAGIGRSGGKVDSALVGEILVAMPSSSKTASSSVSSLLMTVEQMEVAE
jgi:hypothetical protein